MLNLANHKNHNSRENNRGGCLGCLKCSYGPATDGDGYITVRLVLLPYCYIINTQSCSHQTVH